MMLTVAGLTLTLLVGPIAHTEAADCEHRGGGSPGFLPLEQSVVGFADYDHEVRLAKFRSKPFQGFDFLYLFADDC